jgi:hypothetical protein
MTPRPSAPSPDRRLVLARLARRLESIRRRLAAERAEGQHEERPASVQPTGR